MAKRRFIVHPDTIFVVKVYGVIVLGAVLGYCCDAKRTENNNLQHNQSTVDSVVVSPVRENVTDTVKLDSMSRQLIENMVQKTSEKQK